MVVRIHFTLPATASPRSVAFGTVLSRGGPLFLNRPRAITAPWANRQLATGIYSSPTYDSFTPRRLPGVRPNAADSGRSTACSIFPARCSATGGDAVRENRPGPSPDPG